MIQRSTILLSTWLRLPTAHTTGARGLSHSQSNEIFIFQGVVLRPGRGSLVGRPRLGIVRPTRLVLREIIIPALGAAFRNFWPVLWLSAALVSRSDATPPGFPAE